MGGGGSYVIGQESDRLPPIGQAGLNSVLTVRGGVGAGERKILSCILIRNAQQCAVLGYLAYKDQRYLYFHNIVEIRSVPS